MRDSPSLCTPTLSLMTTESFIYQKNDHDAFLVTVRRDSSDDNRCFAEMTNIDPATATSKYIRLEAPLKVIRMSVANLLKKGYKLQNNIGINLKGYATS